MGYDLHITKAELWFENENNQILAEEWLSIVENDDELSIDTNNGAYFANWRNAWFDWYEGNIYTKNPGQETFNKMLQLANMLDAKVQGDDGEIYSNSKDFQPIDNNTPKETFDADLYNQNVPAYKRKDFLQNIILFAIIALVIIAVNVFDLF